MTAIDELREAVRRLGYLEDSSGHGSHRGEHAPADCRYCREWVIRVLRVWRAADQVYGPPSIAKAVLRTLTTMTEEPT